MIREAIAVWRGTGRAGSGNLSTDSGVLANMPYSFKTRFENEKGTNERTRRGQHRTSVDASDPARWRKSARFGAIPLTPLADAIATTLAWHRAHPAFRLPL